jgi:hypothetical protein
VEEGAEWERGRLRLSLSLRTAVLLRKGKTRVAEGGQGRTAEGNGRGGDDSMERRAPGNHPKYRFVRGGQTEGAAMRRGKGSGGEGNGRPKECDRAKTVTKYNCTTTVNIHCK